MSPNYIDKLGWIKIKDNKALVVLSKGENKWFMPGGKREEDETDEEALIREVKEELSVDLIPETIQYFKTFEAQAHGKPQGTMVRITAYTASFKGEILPNNEIDKFDYFSYSEKDELSAVGQLIFEELKNRYLII
ncbi:MAG: NUDIX domain-containing protein [Patescibacteria group bacterium]|nr:NUDIX domain-containing protein [Patescibacteria group bacterium]